MKLSSEEKSFILEKIRKYFNQNEFEIILFGSFASGKANSKSDIDVAIKGKEKISASNWQMLIEEFEESEFLRKIDVIDYARIPLSFQKIIDSTGVKL